MGFPLLDSQGSPGQVWAEVPRHVERHRCVRLTSSFWLLSSCRMMPVPSGPWPPHTCSSSWATGHPGAVCGAQEPGTRVLFLLQTQLL